MATRFGAASPAQTYAARIRWLVGCLVAVILVLVVTLIFISQQTNQGSVESPAGLPEDIAEAPLVQTLDILIANARIEAGTRLMPNMLGEQSTPTDLVPEGAILSRDRPRVIGKFTKTLINANLPLLNGNISDTESFGFVPSSIPPGYRAVTIVVDARSGVEGWARPKTRVDVLWAYVDKRKQKRVATLVHGVKILSVAGMTGDQSSGKAPAAGGTTVTLLVTAYDAKRIELAQTLGKLSLSLLGDQDEITTAGKFEKPVGEGDLPGGLLDNNPTAPPPPDGTLMMKDPRTGMLRMFELRGDTWKPSEDDDS